MNMGLIVLFYGDSESGILLELDFSLFFVLYLISLVSIILFIHYPK